MATKRVTLTFDNGPTAAVTGSVLDVLRDADVRSTFFVCGDQLCRPGAMDIARRAVDEGHWIGNHAMDQPHRCRFGERDDPDLPAFQIGATQELIGPLSHPDRLFRPPGCGGVLDRRLLSQAAVDYLLVGGYTLVLWTNVPHDWDDPDGWVERCWRDVERQEWSVVVLHDLANGAMPHLPRLIAELRAAGVELRQDLPDFAVPIVRGTMRASIDHLVAVTASASGKGSP